MNLLIAHLSDIHLRIPGNNRVMDRAAAISNAVHSAMPDATCALFALVGDLAYSGTPEEYGLAREFLRVLLETYRSRNGNVGEVFIAAVPGNHDCRLDEDQSARDIVMAGLQRNDITKPSVFQTLVRPQRHFYEFLESAIGATVIHPGTGAFSAKTINHGSMGLEIVCINTALCTRKNEVPGSLHLPRLDGASMPLLDSSAAITVVLAHHPPHWLGPESYHDLRNLVISRQALLLTGHEHQPDLWSAGSDDRLAQLIEGGVLQDNHNPDNSSFHTVAIREGEGTITEQTFSWAHNVYVGSAPRRLVWSNSSAPTTAIKLALQPDHARYLEDLGNVITHPDRDAVELSEVFVWPDLRRHSDSYAKGKEASLVRAPDGIDALLASSVSQVNCGARSGRTAYAKRTFYELWAAGKLPLLINGDKLRSHSPTKVRTALEEAVKRNYKINEPDEFFASGHHLVLLVDDFFAVGMNRTGQDSMLGYLRGIFKNIVLFDRGRPDIEEIVVRGNVLQNIHEARQFDLLPLTTAARARLVEKWVRLGKTPADAEPDVSAEILETTRLVETLLGRDYVPRTPFYVLSLLSALQQSPQPTADLGSLGYLYELLIKTSLARATRQPDLMQTYDGFLTDLAFGMYQARRGVVSREEFKAKCEEYASRCLIDFDDRAAEEILRRAMILSFDGGHVLFRYRYLYFFFIAKYISQRLSTLPMQAEVARLVDELHKSEASNVLLFLCHCTSDPIVIETMVRRADSLFADNREVDLNADSRFLSDLGKVAPPLSVGADPAENRARLLEEHGNEEQERAVASGRVYSAELSVDGATDLDAADESRIPEFGRKLTASFKTMEIAGQILRNHPTIQGADKIRLLKACTSLSRRMISSMFEEMSQSAGEVVDAIERDLLANRPSLEPSRARAISRLAFQVSIEGTLLMIIGAYANNFGMTALAPAFKRMRTELPDNTMRVFDLAVRLENPRAFPEADLYAVEKLFSGNQFIWRCLRDMVFLYFYLFTAPERAQKQRVCQKFDIDAQLPAILSKDRKRNA